MKSDKLISIILPTYNRAHCVTRAIDSAIYQTYKNIELIVVDDGSTDNTEEVLKKYTDKVVYIKQGNAGASAARNTGISKAKGEYVAFIDSDDVWLSNKLEKQVLCFDKNPEISLVFTNVTIINEDGSKSKKPEKINHIKDDIYDIDMVFQDPYFGLPTVIIKKNIMLETGLFDETLKTAEDLDLFLRVSLDTKVAYLHEKLVDVYITEGSLSADEGSYEDNLRVINRFVEENNEKLLSHNCKINNVLFNINYDYAESLLWYGKSKQARDRLQIAHQYNKSFKSIYLYAKTFIK
jgi:glycosyltransferase involved in cell wall biosynthesis